jgi:hypothetical protein
VIPSATARQRPARIALALLLGFVFVIATIGPEVAAEEATGRESLGWVAGGILPCLLGLWLAPKVSHRRRDALVFLLAGWAPIACSALLVTIVWRLAYLPHRDWQLRAEEFDAGLRTSHVPAVAAPPPAPEPVVVPAAPSRPPWARDVTTG